jgi:hypothetical protein
MQWLRKGYYSHNYDTDLYWLDVYKLFEKAIKVTPNDLEEERDYLVYIFKVKYSNVLLKKNSTFWLLHNTKYQI